MFKMACLALVIGRNRSYSRHSAAISDLCKFDIFSQEAFWGIFSMCSRDLSEMHSKLFITGHQLFFSKQFTDKSVEEELILYKKHILAAKL